MASDEYFRAMIPDADGRPQVGRGARLLGVRVPEDIAVAPTGTVSPGSGGMSVSPDSAWNVPAHRRPRTYGRGSTGPASDRLYSAGIDAFVGRSLQVRPDPDAPDVHTFVEPAVVVTVAEYEDSLAATRGDWNVVAP